MDHFIATYIDDEHSNPDRHPIQIETLRRLMKAKGFAHDEDYRLETGGSKRDDHTFGISFNSKVLEHPEIKAQLKKMDTGKDPHYGEKTKAATKHALRESSEIAHIVENMIRDILSK